CAHATSAPGLLLPREREPVPYPAGVSEGGYVTRLAVMAHYDPRGELGPHVRRQVEALVSAVVDVPVVTTVELTGEARGWLRERCRLIERPNYGYDFFSYKVGLEQAGDLTRYDEVIVCNDSYVGPLTPYPRMFEAMAERPVDFWGF